MKIKNFLITSVAVVIVGMVIERALVYARTHLPLPIRVPVIIASYVICFGSFVLLRKLLRHEQVRWKEVRRFAVASAIGLIGVATYEPARSDAVRLGTSVALLVIAVVVAVRSAPISGMRLVWILLTVAGAIGLYLLAR